MGNLSVAEGAKLSEVSGMKNSESNAILSFEAFLARLGRETRLLLNQSRILRNKLLMLFIKLRIRFNQFRIFGLKSRYAFLFRW